MSEIQNQLFCLSFDPCPKVDFQGSRVTSDGGALLVPELDECPGLNMLVGESIVGDRQGKNNQLPLSVVLERSIIGSARYKDVNDAWLSLYHPCRPAVAIQRGRRSSGGKVATIWRGSMTVTDAQDVNPCMVCGHAQ